MSLVFASGYLIPQRIKRLEYFRGVSERYPGALFPRVDVAASVEERANQLAEQIDRVFPEGRIDIVGHSMGGLDARFLLSRNLRGLAARVATLSTISTPHRGTPLADLVAGPTPLGPQRLAYETVKDLLAHFGFDVGGLASLTTRAAVSFNQQCPDVPGIGYLAYAGCGPRCYLLRAGGWLIAKAASTADERENDGLVSVASAQWPGTQLAAPPWPVDHLAQIGYDLDRAGAKPDFDYLRAITYVVDHALGVQNAGQARELARGAT
jgi:triacylglycerol lipase